MEGVLVDGEVRVSGNATNLSGACRGAARSAGGLAELSAPWLAAPEEEALSVNQQGRRLGVRSIQRRLAAEGAGRDWRSTFIRICCDIRLLRMCCSLPGIRGRCRNAGHASIASTQSTYPIFNIWPASMIVRIPGQSVEMVGKVHAGH